MSRTPKFERTKDHTYEVNEKVFVIDKNGFDIWEAQITTIQNGTYSVHYPEFPEDDEALPDTSRILLDTRVNRRIFNNQEGERQTILPALSEGEEEPFSDSDSYDDEEGDDYRPGTGSPEPDYSPGKKGKKVKIPASTRPKGARSNPKRHH
jgi:hypothetical protein